MAGNTFRGVLHVSQALSNVAFGFKSMMNIWRQILPPIPVAKETDTYYLFTDRAFMRYYGKVRADKTPAHRVNTYTTSTTTYICKVHSYDDIVSDRERDLADAIVKPEIRMTNVLMQICDNDIETDVHDAVFASGNFSGYTSTPSEKWNAANPDSTPLENVDAQMTAVAKIIGVRPNTMIVGAEVHDQLKRHPDILDIYKYTGKGILSRDMVRAAFDVENYLVGEAAYVSTKKGQTETPAYLWGKHCALLYVAKNPAAEEPSWGYTMMHQLYGTLTAKVKKYRDEKIEGDVIEAGVSYDIKQTSQNAGYLFTDVVS